MKFEFEQTAEDLRDLSKYSLNKIIKYIGIGVLIFILLKITPSLIKAELDISALFSWFIPFVILLLFWLIIIKFATKYRLNNPKDIMLGKREIELLDNEILFKTPISETSWKWAAITELKQSKNSYLLYIGKFQALIIPKRVFETEEEKIMLENFINERIIK